MDEMEKSEAMNREVSVSRSANRNRWGTWWTGLSPFQKLFPASFVLIYWVVLNLLEGLRGDHVYMGLAILALNYLGAWAKKLQKFLLPLLLTAIIYDSQRFYSDYIRGRVRVEEPYFFDKNFFGITTPNGVLTPNEWLQNHIHPALDLVTGFFYLTFVAIFVLIAAYFYFWRSRTGTKKLPAEKIKAWSPQVMWSFFWVNIIGYSTYYWYPAAPPWYVSMYGLGPARMDALPNPAGCIRFDEILGTQFFTGMYGRSADVFGAIPSLHVAYPFLAVYYAYRFGAARGFSLFFYLIMCFAAVYLNHHYILDLIWGTAYALITAVAMDFWYRRRQTV